MTAQKKRPLIIITGPTAVGKSSLSIEIAKKYNGSIISADSMQVYKYMDIGTNKICKDEMQGITHYLIDELEPTEDFNVVTFKSLGEKALEDIYSRGKLPIIVGGTGFYIQALLYSIDFTNEDSSIEIREELERYANENGAFKLHSILKEIDPESADAIHPNNIKRVLRAIEFYRLTGKKISMHNFEERAKESPYAFLYLVLNDDRSRLYSKIDKRVDEMISEGLVDEVKALKNIGCTSDMVSMQGLGYKEILEFLDGSCSLEEAIYKIKRDTRHYAKKQITWFKREKDVIWVNKNEFSDMEDLKKNMFDRIDKLLDES